MPCHVNATSKGDIVVEGTIVDVVIGGTPETSTIIRGTLREASDMLSILGTILEC